MRCKTIRIPSALGLLLVLASPATHAGATSAQEASGPIVAVFEIEDTRPAKARLSDRERADLTAYLSAAITEGGTYRVVPPEQLRAALQEKKNESYRQCFDERCQIEIGKEVSAQKTLATRIMQVGKQCAVIATLYDLRQAASERATTYKGACDKDKLFEGLEILARNLRGTEAAGQPATGGTQQKPADSVAAEKLYQDGLAALQKGEVDTALKNFEASERAGFTDWKLANDLYHQWGEIYRTQKKDPAKAAEKFQRCVDISEDKTDWPAYWCIYLLGILAYDQGQSDRAIDLFQQALSFMADASWIYKNDIYHMLGEAYRVQKKDPAKAAEFHQKAVDISEDKSDWPAYWSEYILGFMAWEQTQPDRAISLYQQALAWAPNMHWTLKNDIYHMLGEAYRVQKKDPAKAAEFHQKAVDISEDKSEWPAYWSEYALGLVAWEQSQPDRAIAHYQQALAWAPNMHWTLKNDIYHMLGEAYRVQKKDPAKAAEFHQKAVDVSEDKSEWPAYWSEYILGVMAAEQNQPDKAISLYQQALAWAPNMHWTLKNDIYHMLGEAYRNLKQDPAKAAEFHQKAVDVSEDKSDWPAPWSEYVLGLMAYQQGNSDRATALFQQALAWAPNMHWTLKNDIYHVLGETYRLQKKDLAKAVEFHQKAWDISEDKTDWPAFWSRYILGVIAFDQGNADRAIECFGSLRDLLPRIAWIYQNDIDYYWGETYRTLKKDPARAAPFYQDCLKASQDLSDWPAYWCLFRQGEIARDAGRKGEAAEMMIKAEAAGKADAGFLQEVDRTMRAAGMR